MTPVPYKLKAYRSAQDGRFYGELWYGNNSVDQIKEGDVLGHKKFSDLEQWGRAAAMYHKHTISPAETHTTESTFVV